MDTLPVRSVWRCKEQPESYEGRPKTKLLRRTLELILDEILRDPNAVEYRLGNTLAPGKVPGALSAVLSLQYRPQGDRLRLGNRRNNTRKVGARTNPYAIFNIRLRDGDPPDDWDDLFRKAGNTPVAFRRYLTS